MKEFLHKINLVLQDNVLRRRLLITVALLVAFRLLAIIPIPGIDHGALGNLFANNQLLGLLNIFSGGGLSQVSIVMLGVGPYITASIIMQLLTVMVPQLKEMYTEEGEAGRLKFAQWSRLLTVPLALVQGFAFIKLLQGQNVITSITGFSLLTNLLVIATGSILLMWIGELITEYGIGNGVSLIIFAGIVARLPAGLSQLSFVYSASQIPVYILFAAIAALVIAGVVVITEAERPIPVTYAKQVRGNKVYGGTSTYLPLRLNQAGVIPIIFALSILLFPQLLAKYLISSTIAWVALIAGWFNAFLSNAWAYGIAYFFLVVIFTYFYTAVTFDPDQISENLQKNGAFIPGVRPGKSTADYIAKILTRLTLFGAVFLGLIAILPLIIRGLTGITALTIGGTALIIVVTVVIDLVKKIDGQISIREY